MIVQPVTLQGTYVRLEPLALAHLDGLCDVGLDEELWRWGVASLVTREDMHAYILDALRSQEQGGALPFVTVLQESGMPIGSTRFGAIDHHHRRVEIGWTWIARRWQRTPVNTEAKYLMLEHAFEQMGCIRVEFKTDSLNEQSRSALLRIGAREEGVLRNHMVTWSGRLRHSVYFSIIESEWPRVKSQLEEKLHKPFRTHPPANSL